MVGGQRTLTQVLATACLDGSFSRILFVYSTAPARTPDAGHFEPLAKEALAART